MSDRFDFNINDTMDAPVPMMFRLDGGIEVDYALLSDDAFDPVYEHDGDSGFSLRLPRDTWIRGKSWKLIPLDLKFQPPKNHEIQVRSRSGRTLKQGLVVAQGTGTVDQPYRGNVGVILYNRSNRIIELKRGEAVAQGVVCYVPPVTFNKKSQFELDDTTRGDGGYGSTGK